MASQRSSVAYLERENPTLGDGVPSEVSPQYPFLKLAPEIRDMIYEKVLTATLPPPRNPTDRSRRQCYENSLSRASERGTRYPIKPLPSPANSFLLTCHQVQNEIIDLFLHERKRKRDCQYELSITVMEETSLYPTWLLVPPVVSDIAGLVWVDIRNAGSRISHSFGSGWTPSDGRVSMLTWALVDILDRFLLHGPLFSNDGPVFPLHDTTPSAAAEHLPHLKPQCHPIKELKLLVLNVIIPTEAEMRGMSFIPAFAPRNLRQRLDGLAHPVTVMGMLERDLRRIINRLRGTTDKAQLVYERVKCIRLCIDGKQRCSWDVTERKRLYPMT